jgi:hypothetical protein
MIDRSRLHELIDSLPEAALAVAQGALENFQSWPPKRTPAQLSAQKGNMDRMRGSMRPGTLGDGGGGGGYFTGPGGRIEYGHRSYSHWEGNTFVVTTHRFYAANEFVIEERMRSGDDGASITYSHSVTGPDNTKNQREIRFIV